MFELLKNKKAKLSKDIKAKIKSSKAKLKAEIKEEIAFRKELRKTEKEIYRKEKRKRALEFAKIRGKEKAAASFKPIKAGINFGILQGK